MTAYAHWSTVAVGANTFSYSTDRYTAINNGAQAQALVGQSITTGRYRMSFQYVSGGGSAFGISDTASLSGVNPGPSLQTYTATGQIRSQGAAVETVGSYSPGDWTDFVFDADLKLAWARYNGGNWNGNPSADPDTNTGGVDISYMTSGITPYFLAYNTSGTPTTILNSGASAYAYTMPTTFNDLPATLAVNIVKVMELGSPVQFTWTANDLNGLNYSLDGGAWTACTGTVTGASGTANGPTIDTEGVHHIQFQDPNQTLDETANITFAIVSKPSGAGSLLAASAASQFSGTTGAGATGSLSSPTQAFIYKFYMDVNNTGPGVTGNPGFYVTGTDSNSDTLSYETNAGEWNSSGDNGMQGFEGLIPVSGPQYVQIGTSTTMTGTVTVADSGANSVLTGTITNNGTQATYNYVDTGLSNGAQFTAWQIGIGVIYPFVDPTFDWYMGIWGPSAPEALSIATGSYSPGTLSIGGECENSTLGTLNISTDNGSTFHPATSLSVTGTAYSATLAGSLTAGDTYQLVAQDAATLVESSPYALSIPGETLTLDTAVFLAGTLTLTGSVADATLTALNGAIDGSSFDPVSSLSITGSAFTALMIGALSAGPHTVQVQDAVTSVVSNTLTFTAVKPRPIPAVIWPSDTPPQISLQKTLPAYLYQEYADDDNLQAFIAAFNALAQQYVDWFNGFNYPVYAGNPNVVGPALDWIAQSLYGMARPVLASGSLQLLGAIATDFIGELAIGATVSSGNEVVYGTTDDIFKRILTWHLYKGDGKQFTIKWLKRRIMRFCFGINGTDYIIDTTYNVAVGIADGVVTITLGGIPPYISSIFQAAVAQGILELPPFYTYVVNIL